MKKICLSVLLLIVLVSPVLAHEKRQVSGRFIFVVGFVHEPAFAGEMNGVDLRVMNIANEEPVEGAEKTLKVTVLREAEQKSIGLEFKTRYKEPGRYAGYFKPTKAGAYVFVISGTIDGTPVAERFESAHGKFHDVEEPLNFP